MYPPNRDLWLLTKKIEGRSGGFETEVEQLMDLLKAVENHEAFCRASEVMNVNRNTFITSKRKIRKIIRSKYLKPFVFICNKN